MEKKRFRWFATLLIVSVCAMFLGAACSNNNGTPDAQKYSFEIHWKVDEQEIKVDSLKEGDKVTPPDGAQFDDESNGYRLFLNGWTQMSPDDPNARIEDFTDYVLTVSDFIKERYSPKDAIPLYFFAVMGSEPINYAITYELYGGDNADGNPTSYNAESFDYDYLKPATKPDYSFVRWTNADGTVTYEKTEDFKTEYNALTIYAEFVPALELSQDGTQIINYRDTVELNVPEGVTDISLGLQDSILKKITVPSTVTSLYINVDSVEEFVVDENNPIFCSEDGVIFNKEKTELVLYPAAKTDTEYVVPESVTAICDYGFWSTQYTEKVVLPDTLNYLGYRAFFATDIMELNIPSALTDIEPDTINIAGPIFIPTTVKYLRQGAISASAIFVEASGETNFGDTTVYENNWNCGCEVIYKANPAKRNYGVLTYGDFEFAVTGGNYEDEEFAAPVTILKYIGSGGEVTVPDSFALQSDGFTYNYTVTRIGNNAFLNNDNTTKVYIPNTVATIGYCAFFGNRNLEEISLVNPTASRALWKIEDSAFDICYKLRVANIVLKDDGGQGYIGNNAFYDCRALEKYVISYAASYVGARAFCGCENVTIYVRHSEDNACMQNWSPAWDNKDWNGNEKQTVVYNYENIE